MILDTQDGDSQRKRREILSKETGPLKTQAVEEVEISSVPKSASLITMRFVPGPNSKMVY